MSEPYDTAAVVRTLLEAAMGQVRHILDGAGRPAVAVVFAVTIEIEGVAVNVAASYPADDAGAAIELAISTAKVMSEALS